MAHKDNVTFSDVIRLVNKSLTDFYSYDSILLDYETEDIAVAERCMVFRIGWYMLNRMQRNKKFHWADLDCEYNRNFRDPKYIYVEDHTGNNTKKKNVVPDLLIHKRRSNENNLLVIEFKKGEPEQNDRNNDIRKLTFFTDSSSEYSYSYGLYIELHKNSAIVQVYQEGEHCAYLDYQWQKKNPEPK